jgi:hypothetical protein
MVTLLLARDVLPSRRDQEPRVEVAHRIGFDLVNKG